MVSAKQTESGRPENVSITVALENECDCSNPHERHGSFVWAGAGEPVKHIVTNAVISQNREPGGEVDGTS